MVALEQDTPEVTEVQEAVETVGLMAMAMMEVQIQVVAVAAQENKALQQ